MSPTPAAPSASSSACCRTDAKAGYVETVRAEYQKVAEAHAPRAKPTSSACRSPRRAPMRTRSTGRPTRRRSRPSSARKVFESWDLAELARYIDWTPFFQTWELKGRYPEILEDEEQGAAARQLFDDAQAMLDEDHRRELVRAARPSSASGRPMPSATTSGSSPTRAATQELATFFTLRQQLTEARRQAERRAVRFRRAGRQRQAGLCRRLRRHRRHRGSGDRRALRARQRRLFLDPGQGAGRPLRRGLRRAHARARAQGVLGLCAGREPCARRADRRALSRHPPGARLSGAARPHREGDAVPPARRRAANPASA